MSRGELVITITANARWWAKPALRIATALINLVCRHGFKVRTP